jgi:hypothetical protein
MPNGNSNLQIRVQTPQPFLSNDVRRRIRISHLLVYKISFVVAFWDLHSAGCTVEPNATTKHTTSRRFFRLQKLQRNYGLVSMKLATRLSVNCFAVWRNF